MKNKEEIKNAAEKLHGYADRLYGYVQKDDASQTEVYNFLSMIIETALCAAIFLSPSELEDFTD